MRRDVFVSKAPAATSEGTPGRSCRPLALQDLHDLGEAPSKLTGRETPSPWAPAASAGCRSVRGHVCNSFSRMLKLSRPPPMHSRSTCSCSLSLFAASTGRLRRNAPFGAAGDRKVPAPGARKRIFAGLGLKMLEGRWPRSTSSKWRHARLSVRVRKIVTSSG